MLDQPDISSVVKRNLTISKANGRLRELREAGIKHSAREMAQGVEITIIRPGFGGNSRSYEIIPWET